MPDVKLTSGQIDVLRALAEGRFLVRQSAHSIDSYMRLDRHDGPDGRGNQNPMPGDQFASARMLRKLIEHAFVAESRITAAGRDWLKRNAKC